MVKARARGIAIVAYGAPKLLAQALAGLSDEDIVVVDNSSSCEVRRVADAAGAHYVDAGFNRGFAAGVNLALHDFAARGVRGDVLLLNPDARLTSAELDRLQDKFDEPGNEMVAVISPSLVSPSGASQRVAWPYPSPRRMWREAFGLRSAEHSDTFVVGAALLIREETLQAVGLFDERYFLYAEEADWQRRAAARGWRSMVAADVIAEHVGGGTSDDSARQQALFHAGQETYIRRWFGSAGWLSYRLAALSGAIVRSVVLVGPRRKQAWVRARLYLRGPRRVAEVGARSGSFRIAHLVVTNNAAGTERYVSEVAAAQARHGHDVTVIGGDENYMRRTLPTSVIWRPGGSLHQAAGSLLISGRHDIVHSHLTAADLLATATVPWHRGHVVSTRHIAKPRGSSMIARLASRIARRRISAEISISEYVGRAINVPATVVHNAVRNHESQVATESKIVLIAQRLDKEKATEVALQAWAASGLAANGWRLVVCGDGAHRMELVQYQAEHSIAGVEWLGWVADATAMMLNSAALLAPAPSEPFGLSVLEAMSIGLPVIAAAGGGHIETVGSAAHALLFAPGNAQACAEQLLAFSVMSAEERRAYGDELRSLQRRKFGLVEHVSRLDDVYSHVLGKRPIELRPAKL